MPKQIGENQTESFYKKTGRKAGGIVMKEDTKLLLAGLLSDNRAQKGQMIALKRFIKKWCLDIPDESAHQQAERELDEI